MEIDLALLADAATIDASGKLNILGVFDRIGVRQLPTQHGRIALVLRFVAGVQEAGSHSLRIRLSDPAGAEVVGLDGELQIGPGARSVEEGVRVPHVLNLDGLIFQQAGRYFFEVQVDGEHHVSIPLIVAAPNTSVASA